MRTIKLPDCVIVVNDNPNTLPEARRIEEMYYSLIESGLGHTIEDIDRTHISKIMLFVGSDDVEALVQAINNLRFYLDNALNREYSASSLAFAVCIEGVDGLPVDDYTEDGLKELLKTLSMKGLTDEIVQRELGIVKKKSIPS